MIVGLGNPGKGYARTRHNAGFIATDFLSKEFGVGEWKEQQKFMCKMQEGRIVTVPILFIQPQTFMNRSGECIRKIIDFYKLDASQQLLVLTDDVDLPLGDLRIRMKGGPGTHNGMRSIVEQIGENFPRLRIGLGTPSKDIDLATWVVSAPPPEEETILLKAIESIPAKVKEFILEKPLEQ